MTSIREDRVLCWAGFAAPVIGAYAPLGLAPLVVVTALAAVIIRRVAGGPWPAARWAIAVILGAAFVWALASITWGIEPHGSALSGVLRLALVILSGVATIEVAAGLSAQQRETVRRGLLAGLGATLLLLAVDRVFDAPIRRLLPMSPSISAPGYVLENFNRGISFVAIVVFPAAAALWARRGAVAGLALWTATFVVALLLTSGSAQLGMILGGLAFAAVWGAPRLFGKVIAIGLTVLVLAMPLLARAIPPPDELPPVGTLPIPNSGHHRLQIWRFAADRILERPLLGWGYDSSRSIPGANASLAKSEPALPLHPHNAMLQWWLELGIVGGVLGAAVVAAIATAMRHAVIGRVAFAAANGQLVCGFVIAALGFGAWQGWWVAALMLSAAMTAATAERA